MEPFRFGTTVIGQMIRSMQRQKASILAVRESGYTTPAKGVVTMDGGIRRVPVPRRTLRKLRSRG